MLALPLSRKDVLVHTVCFLFLVSFLIGGVLLFFRVQGPPHLLCLVAMIATFVFAIILLGLAGHQNDVCRIGNLGILQSIFDTWCAATGLGVTAGVFGMLLGILGILWLILTELWDVGILKFVLAGGMFFTALLAFIAGVIFAVSSSDLADIGIENSEVAAAAAFGFFTMLAAAAAGVFAFLAGGGGTATN